jgi:hypothetical protein
MELINMTKMFKRGIIICLFFWLQLAFNLSTYAQSTELRIIDLSIRSKALYQIDKLEENNQLDTLLVVFKMNKADLAAKVIVHIGDKEGRKNILETEFPIIQDGGSYYVNTGNKRFQIKGYSTYFEVPINKSDSEDLFYFTIYVEDHSGQVTPELKYKL